MTLPCELCATKLSRASIHNVLGGTPHTLFQTCLKIQCVRRDATSHPRLKIDQSENTLPLNMGCKRRNAHHIVWQELRPNVTSENMAKHRNFSLLQKISYRPNMKFK